MYIRVSGVKQQISRIIILPVTGIHKPRTYIDAGPFAGDPAEVIKSHHN
jgi:hypothetical protein